MKITEAQVRFIVDTYPEARGDNTEFCKRFWEHTCISRELDINWGNIKAIMNEYKPESLTRKRREFIESTDDQRRKEMEYVENYVHKHFG